MLRQIILTAAVATGAVFMGSTSAQAQWGGLLGGLGSSFGASGYHSAYGGYGIGSHRVVTPGYPSYRSGYGGYHSGHHSEPYCAPRVWHDTTHLDYHAPSLQRHGRHFHYVPGHYDVHRSGHWDSVHGGHDGHHDHH